MGRLFRKIFAVILLAQFTTVLGVSGALLLRDVALGDRPVPGERLERRFDTDPSRWPPPPLRPHVPWLPLGVGVVASLAFAALLAWSFSKPIRDLRRALAAAACGNLDVRIAATTAARRDELGDLGHGFEHGGAAQGADGGTEPPAARRVA